MYKTVLPTFKLDVLKKNRSVRSAYVKVNAEIRNFLHLVNSKIVLLFIHLCTSLWLIKIVILL